MLRSLARREPLDATNLLYCVQNTLYSHVIKLQWATKVVETLLGNNNFPYLSTCSILIVSSVNSPITPPPPNSICGLRSQRN